MHYPKSRRNGVTIMIPATRASMNSDTTPHTADRSQLVLFPTEHACAHEPPPISQCICMTPSLHARSFPAIQTPIIQPYPAHVRMKPQPRISHFPFLTNTSHFSFLLSHVPCMCTGAPAISHFSRIPRTPLPVNNRTFASGIHEHE